MILDELDSFPQGGVLSEVTFGELLVREFNVARRGARTTDDDFRVLKYAIVLGAKKERFESRYSDDMQKLVKTFADYAYANHRYDQEKVRRCDFRRMNDYDAAMSGAYCDPNDYDPVLRSYSPIRRIDSLTSSEFLSEVVSFEKCDIEFADPSLNERCIKAKQRPNPQTKGFWASLFG